MVIHYLKDGTRVEDITGHVVRVQEAEVVYNLMDQINREVSSNERKDDRDH